VKAGIVLASGFKEALGMLKKWNDSRGAVSFLVIVGIVAVTSLLSGWVGFRMAKGSIYAVVGALIIGFLLGLMLLPSLAQAYKWWKTQRD
jgi:uncharacterized membrane protein YraQ (UPF0718 family)